MLKDYKHFSYAIIALLFFPISMICITKNKKNILITIRSITLFHFTNISILFQILILSFFEIVKDMNFFQNFHNIIINLFFIFHFSIFITISFKYFRLLIITNVSEDLNDRYYLNNFQIKNLYYEYLYNRFTMIILIILIIIYIFCGVLNDRIFLKPFLYVIYYYNCSNFSSFPWSIVFFIENLINITLCFNIIFSEIKSELNIRKEIIFYTIINFIYNISLLIFYIKNINFYSLDITFLYLILIYLNQIILPIIYAIRNKKIIFYGPDNDISNDLYLFLSSRKCCKFFSDYLNLQPERKKNSYFLSLFINILDYRLKCIINDKFDKIKSQGEYIIENFITNIEDIENFNDSESLLRLRNTSLSFLERNIFKLDMFDEILIISYNYLNSKFLNFKSSSHEYLNLMSELNYETYLRCKFILCGLLSKE